MRYFPKNDKGVTFSSKVYNPLGSNPKAPNKRLELNMKEHDEFLKDIDLLSLLKHLKLIKDSKVTESSSLNRSYIINLLKRTFSAKLHSNGYF